MNNENITDTNEVTTEAPIVPLRLSPLQLQLLDTAAEMGLDTDFFTQEILLDENCLRGLELVTE